MFQALCHSHGYTAVATFEDEGFPVLKEEPVGLRALLSYLQQPERGFVVVVLPRVDALGPDPLTIARHYFQVAALATRVLFFNSEDDPTDVVIQHWAKSRHQTAGQRVREAMARKAIMGQVLGCIPYGYRTDSRHHLEVEPEEARVVRHIYYMYLQEGLGLRRIAERLNEEGHLTRRGQKWSVIAVRDILRNRVYVGTYSRFGVRIPGSHPALVSADEFRRTEEILAGRRSDSRQPRQPVPFLLAGLVYCASCGNKMIGVTRYQKWHRSNGQEREALYRYYQCQSRANQSWCDYNTHRADELEEMVRRGLAGEGDVGMVVLPKGEDQTVGTHHQNETQGRRLSQSLRRLDRRLESYMEAAARHQITRQQLAAAAMSLALERLELEKSLTLWQRRGRNSLADRQKEQEAVLSQLQHQWEEMAFAERQALLQQVVHRITVGDGSVLVILSL